MNAKVAKELRHNIAEAMIHEQGPGASLETRYKVRSTPFIDDTGVSRPKNIIYVDPDCFRGRYLACKKWDRKIR
jgi:hypothetical protein